MALRSSLVHVIRSLAFVGVTASDTEDIRAQKATLTLAALCVTGLAFIWVGTYFALGLPTAGAIPLAYQVASVVSLAVFSRSKDYRFFRFSQATMLTLLPFLLQWTLGGFAASSAVSLWALVAAIGTLFFFTAGASIPWFVAFLGLTIASALFESTLAEHAASIPESVRTAFFALNVTGVSLTAYLLLQYAVRARDEAFARSEGLLLNVLPKTIAERLKREPGVIADAYTDVTVLFADVVDFTPFAARTGPERVVEVLDEIFSAFDALAAEQGVEKIKTIGDAYMVVAGLPEPRAEHATAMAEMALDMQYVFGSLTERLGLDLALRIGMDTGPVVAGVIGRHKFTYDLWGDTVNTASRMESHGVAGRIQVSESVHQRLSARYLFDDRGPIEVKGKGRQNAYLLVGRRTLEHADPG